MSTRRNSKRRASYPGSKKRIAGQINAGVSHSIKKPKRPKKLSLQDASRIFDQITENSPLNELLNDFGSIVPDQPAPATIKPAVNPSPMKPVESPGFEFEDDDDDDDDATMVGSGRGNNETVMSSSEIANIIDSLGEDVETSNSSPPEPVPERPNLFPIFYTDMTRDECEKKKSPARPKEIRKMKDIRDKSQMLLDAGQKKFGLIQCPECEIMYQIGDPGDKIMHENYHNNVNVLQYNNWKHERIVLNDTNGKVIKVISGDPATWWKKVEPVVDVVNRDLGFYDIRYSLTKEAQVYLYIKSRKIVGVLIAEPQKSGNRLLTKPEDEADLCSELTYPIKCGVSRIWVHKLYRKYGIASILMDCLKNSFIPGEVLENDDIAFSSPTQMGKFFGASYFKTTQFLIYG